MRSRPDGSRIARRVVSWLRRVRSTTASSGRRAPAGLRGFAEFNSGKLTDLSFTRGVRTATGVRVGQTTITRMVSRYRAVGFLASARFVDTFGGTFVAVRRRNGRQVLAAFAQGRVITTISVPAVPVCE